MCNFQKRKRYNEEEDVPVKGQSSYLKMKSRSAKMACELEQVSLTLHQTERTAREGRQRSFRTSAEGSAGYTSNERRTCI